MTKRLPSIKSLEKKLWDLCREYVFLRDKSKCQHCGRKVSGRSRQPSHVIPKSRSKVLRWDYHNVKTLCGGCHIWWHGFPTESGEWFKEEFPDRQLFIEGMKNVKMKDELMDRGATYREWLEDWIHYYESAIRTISKG